MHPLPAMKLPRDFRGPRKIFQIWVTRMCDKSCFGCTQGSNLAGRFDFITPDQFDEACLSMEGYPGVIAMFGGNPCLHPHFHELCDIMRKRIPFNQRGIWTNKLLGKGKVCRHTFNPAMSNFNLHLDTAAAEEFRQDWPEAIHLKGLTHDCRHSPPWVAIRDVISDEDVMWEKIGTCDINQRWSAMIGVFRGQLRGWFCEIAGAQSILHQEDPDYPDTGLVVKPGWWRQGMEMFEPQIRKHCPECGIPLRAVGTLAVNGEKEQVSETHANIFRPKRKGRPVEIVRELHQLGGTVAHATDYLANYKAGP